MPRLRILSAATSPTAGQSVLARRLRGAGAHAGFELAGEPTGDEATIQVGLPPSAAEASRLLERATTGATPEYIVWERLGHRVCEAHHDLDVPPNGSGMNLITLNETFVTTLRNLFPSARVEHLPPPVPPEAFNRRSKRGRRSAAVFVGRFVPAKGALWLAETWVDRVYDRVPLRLVMCGSGEGAVDSEERSIRSLAASHPERLSVCTYRSFAERQRVLDAAALAVFPYRYDHLPQALLEAMAASVPVLASDLAEFRSVVIPGRTGALFAEGSVGSLCAAVASALGDTEGSHRMAELGRTAVLDRCSYHAVGQRLAEIVGRPDGESR